MRLSSMPAVGLGADYWRNTSTLSFDTVTIPEALGM
jgi:hypothetical protein